MIKVIGIIGAGQMGNGIAHIASLSGFQVKLLDSDKDALRQATQTIDRNMERQVRRSIVSDSDRAAALGRIETGHDYAMFESCDIVIEAATEQESIKQEIFQTLIPHLSDKAIIATNTSSISITRLGAGTDRPDRFIGMHFMNPVPIMKLVEIIRGDNTSDETCEQTIAWSEAIGKTCGVANDFPGFIANRILMPMINEAVWSLHTGVGDRESIDIVMNLGCNFPMGPLALADYIGLDICLSIMEVMHQGLKEDKYAPCPLLGEMVTAGKLGVKSGAGFYDYE